MVNHNRDLVLPGRSSQLIQPLSTLQLGRLKLSRKLKAACFTDAEGKAQGIIILEDTQTGWLASDVEDIKRLHDVLGAMIVALENPRRATY